MSEKKLSDGEQKVIANYDGTIKGTHLATGLSYGYCRKVLSLDYIKAAIKETKEQASSGQEQKVDRRIGNQFWKARSSHGRNPIFESPEKLWEAAKEYFEWVDNNPLYETKPFAYQGKVVVKELPKMRAMTIDGLCIFLDIDASTWFDYCKRKGEEGEPEKDFTNVTTRITKIIKTQKFAGAAADLLNANIIARDLGLAEKKEVTGQGGGPIESVSLSTEEYKKARKEVLEIDDC
jgi:hypothetical protein